MAARKVKATFDYMATEPGELSIKKGDIIVVLEEDATGWWKGDLKGVVGFFPSNFSEPYEEQKMDTEWSQRRMSMAPKPVKDNVSTNASGDEYVRAKHNYKGSAVDGELSFTKGDIIKVINKDESGWWKGELSGKIGFLPHNFVTPCAPPTSSSAGGSSNNGDSASKATGARAAAATASAAPSGPPAATAVSASSTGGGSAASKAKALKTKAATAPTTVAAPTAQPAAATSNARVAELEEMLRAAEAEAEAARKRAAEAASRAQEAEQRATDSERRIEELSASLNEAEARQAKAQQAQSEAELELRRWNADRCADWDLNLLRDQKHRLKASLERVQVALNNTKACPSCESAVKDCILVPCLHAFCHKCGEKNKKQVKCSVCGLAPERIYLLGGKK